MFTQWTLRLNGVYITLASYQPVFLSCATWPSGFSQTKSLFSPVIDIVTVWCLGFSSNRIHHLCVCKSKRYHWFKKNRATTRRTLTHLFYSLPLITAQTCLKTSTFRSGKKVSVWFLILNCLYSGFLSLLMVFYQFYINL